MSSKIYPVMVNGLPGKMAKIIAGEIFTDEAKAFLADLPEPHFPGLNLLKYSLTGPNMPSEVHIPEEIDPLIADSFDGYSIELVAPENHKEFLCNLRMDNLLAIDFVKGEGQANKNAELYFENKIPFVMGSTGADYEMIDKLARKTKTPCVAFPNMDQRIVALMYGISQMAEKCPGAFEDTEYDLMESHQVDKKDTSGTFKEMIKHLSRLGEKEVVLDDITKLRDDSGVQAKLIGIPKNWIGWHAYHFLKVSDDDGSSEELTFKRH